MAALAEIYREGIIDLVGPTLFTGIFDVLVYIKSSSLPRRELNEDALSTV